VPKLPELTSFLRDLHRTRLRNPECHAAWVNAVEAVRLSRKMSFSDVVEVIATGGVLE
jgi:hypothetical protein